MAAKREVLEIAGHEVGISNPDKVFFPDAGGAPVTKRDLVAYYMAVAGGALRGVARRPMLLKRFPDGITAEPFFQKRAPDARPDWIDISTMSFPSGRTADHVVISDAAQLAWIINLGCVDLNPHPVRKDDIDRPDELRVDLDPVPGVEWRQIVAVAKVARDVLADVGLTGWPKTSGSRGIHVYARIRPEWTFDEVRRAALTIAREVERRAPDIATSKWWKEERHGVFLDYNQNAKDRTVASAYSVRPTPDARVSMPFRWEDIDAIDPAAFTLRTVPAILEAKGDAHEGIDEAAGSLEALLEMAKALEAEGVGDAPWPPHFAKAEGEAPRVAPSRKKKATSDRSPTGRRKSAMPLLVIAQAATKAEALEGLERWKLRHPHVAAVLAVDDVLVDAMRGRHKTWTRIRVNLRHVPEAERPAQATPDPDYDPAVEWKR